MSKKINYRDYSHENDRSWEWGRMTEEEQDLEVLRVEQEGRINLLFEKKILRDVDYDYDEFLNLLTE